MKNASFEITDFLLKQARNIRGNQEYDDFVVYSNTPEEERAKLDRNIKNHYANVMRVIEKMASYKNNHWWVMLNSNEVKRTSQLANLRRNVRIYYQVFDCGLDTMLIPDGQLVNDINDLIIFTRKAVTSWIIKNPSLFASYKANLKEILDKDQELQDYLKEINSE